MSDFSMQQAYDWFSSEIKEWAPNYTSLQRAWEPAKAKATAGVSKDSWKSWVTDCCEAARGPRVQVPLGFLIMKLGDSKPGVTRVRKRTSEERAEGEHKRTQDWIRLVKDGECGHPPLMYGFRAVQEGFLAEDVYEAWAAAGRPSAADWPYPFEQRVDQ